MIYAGLGDIEYVKALYAGPKAEIQVLQIGKMLRIEILPAAVALSIPALVALLSLYGYA